MNLINLLTNSIWACLPSLQDEFLLPPSETDERARQDRADKDDDANNHRQTEKAEKVPRRMLSRGTKGSRKRFSNNMHCRKKNPPHSSKHLIITPMADTHTCVHTRTHIPPPPSSAVPSEIFPRFSFSWNDLSHYEADNWADFAQWWQAQGAASNCDNPPSPTASNPHTHTHLSNIYLFIPQFLLKKIFLEIKQRTFADGAKWVLL